MRARSIRQATAGVCGPRRMLAAATTALTAACLTSTLLLPAGAAAATDPAPIPTTDGSAPAPGGVAVAKAPRFDGSGTLIGGTPPLPTGADLDLSLLATPTNEQSRAAVADLVKQFTAARTAHENAASAASAAEVTLAAARVELKRTEQERRSASHELGRFAARTYRSGGMDQDLIALRVLATGEPQDALNGLSTLRSLGGSLSGALSRSRDAERDHRRATREVEQAAREARDAQAAAQAALVTVAGALAGAERELGLSETESAYSLWAATGQVPAPVVSAQRSGGQVAPLGARQDPYLVVSGVDAAAAGRVAAAFPGTVTGRTGTVAVAGQTVALLGVDPSVARALAPAGAAEVDPLWQAVARGEAVLSHAAAVSTKAPLGGTVDLAPVPFDAVLADRVPALQAGGTTAPASGGAPVAVPVGAYATLGWPGSGVVVNEAVAAGLGATSFMALVPVDADRRTPATIAALAATAGPGARVRVLGAMAPTAADFLPAAVAQAMFGSFTYRPVGGGRLAPDPAWVQANIVTAPVPILGNVTMHRLAIPQMRGALNEIVARGLADKIHPGEYGGAYVPRYIANTTTPSFHTYGTAFDVNVPTNGRGGAGDLDREVVQIFKSWGFAWGGDWKWTDPMHFELAALLRPDYPVPAVS